MFWTILKVPEYLNIEDKPLSEEGCTQSFLLNEQSFKLMLLFYFFTSQLLERGQESKNMEEIKNEYDKRYCRLDPKIEEAF